MVTKEKWSGSWLVTVSVIAHRVIVARMILQAYLYETRNMACSCGHIALDPFDIARLPSSRLVLFAYHVTLPKDSLSFGFRPQVDT